MENLMEQQKDDHQKQPISMGRPVSSLPDRQASDITCGQHQLSNSKSAQNFGYVVRKAEKLTTALYLVTDIMSEKEPMKWRARESAVDILSDITIASSLSISEKMSMLRNVMKKAEKVIAFLDVAQSAHLMSEMNASVMKREYLMLKDSIEGEWNNVYENSKSIFSDSFFEVSRDLLPRYGEVANRSVNQETILPASSSPTKEHGTLVPKIENPIRESIRPLPDRGVASIVKSDRVFPATLTDKRTSMSATPASVGVTQERPLMNVTPTTQTTEIRPTSNSSASAAGGVGLSANSSLNVPGVTGQMTHIQEVTPRGRNEFNATFEREGGGHISASNGVERNDRRKIILALIKQKPALTVRDIVRSIPNVSEKTIQRELFSMVSENILTKRGERRWSTYSLRGV